MRCLVTGGAGFIGSNLVRHLLMHDHRVLNLDALTYAGNVASLSDVERHANYEFQKVDIRSQASVQEALSNFQPDWVFHLAAESHVDRSIDGPQVFVETNVMGTLNLLQSSLRHWEQCRDRAQDFRFIHVSTDEVYGSLGTDGLFSETSPYDPRSPYSASKAASDHLARAWHHTYGLPIMVTNCSNNYGPFQFPEKLIPVVILKCLSNQPIPVYGGGENVRDWLYVEDHCRALEMVAQQGHAGETYNIGGSNERTNLELVQTLCQLLDELCPCSTGKRHADKIEFVSDRPGHDLRYAIDATKIANELSWAPDENFETGFRKTVQWYLQNQGWWQDILSGDYQLERQGLPAHNTPEVSR